VRGQAGRRRRPVVGGGAPVPQLSAVEGGAAGGAAGEAGPVRRGGGAAAGDAEGRGRRRRLLGGAGGGGERGRSYGDRSHGGGVESVAGARLTSGTRRCRRWAAGRTSWDVPTPTWTSRDGAARTRWSPPATGTETPPAPRGD